MIPYFIDTSVIVRKLFGEPEPWEKWSTLSTAYCSRLVRLELKRTIDRERLTGHIDDEQVARLLEHVQRLLSSMHVIDLNADLLDRAEAPLPTVVKSLDALHLVTAVCLQRQLGGPLIFATHDVAQGRCARALGLSLDGALSNE